jgi:hypothetical protein
MSAVLIPQIQDAAKSQPIAAALVALGIALYNHYARSVTTK